jgi:hypothetical protein
MFTTIKTISPPENFFGKIKYRLLPPAIKSEIIDVPDGSGYLSLTVPLIKGEIVWNSVRSAAGKNAENLVLPKWINPPQSNTIKPFKSIDFPRRVMMNSALRVLSLRPRSHIISEIAVIDIMGGCAELIGRLPDYCGCLKIITSKPQRYENFRMEAMEKYGVAAVITEDISKAFYSPLVLIPSPIWKPVAFSRMSNVISVSSDNIYSSRVFVPDGIALEEKYSSLLPYGVSPLYFACALYEISGVSGLKDSCCTAFRQNNTILSYREVISMLD